MGCGHSINQAWIPWWHSEQQNTISLHLSNVSYDGWCISTFLLAQHMGHSLGIILFLIAYLSDLVWNVFRLNHNCSERVLECSLCCSAILYLFSIRYFFWYSLMLVLFFSAYIFWHSLHLVVTQNGFDLYL